MRARRLEVVDEYAEDGRLAILSMQGMVVVLSELATAAWSVLGEDWSGAEEVSAELVRRFGEPPDGDGARATTENALRTLAGHGLVEIADTGAR